MYRKRLNRSVAGALFAFAIMATVAVSARPDSGGTAPMQDSKQHRTTKRTIPARLA